MYPQNYFIEVGMNFLRSSIGKKQLVGLAGVGLSLFVLAHMLGNLTMFISPEAYNRYGHALTSNKLIYVAEMGLISIFLLHIIVAIGLSIYNRAAKGGSYAVPAKKSKASYASRTMWFQGVIIFAFVIWHLRMFKYGREIYQSYDGVLMRDLYALLVESFQQPLTVVTYVVVMILLGLHLGHGFSSSFQSLGLNGEKYDAKLKLAGKIYAAVVMIGFIAQPVYIFFVA